MPKLFLYFSIVIMLGYSMFANADSSSEIDDFIAEASAPPYDCPKSSLSASLQSYRNADNTNDEQKFALEVINTHLQICENASVEAAKTLDKLLAIEDVDQSNYFYAMAMYQRAFIYDIQEDPIRCEFYARAKELSKDRHPKILLSATLGDVTVCGNLSDAEKLGMLFPFVERLTEDGDPKALAHLYNNIGLLYAQLGQHVLAAEQYSKAHEIGWRHYEGSNKLSILVNVITSYMASGMFDEANSALNQFRIINEDVNTSLTNFHLLFMEAGYFYRTENYKELAASIATWESSIKEQISNPLYIDLLEWYKTVICVVDKDMACMEAYLEYEENSSSRFARYTAHNKDYLRFKADLYFALGDYNNAEKAYEQFANRMYDSLQSQQQSGKIFGVANLYSQIVELEGEVKSAEAQQIKLIWIFVFCVLLSAFFLYWYLRKRQLAQASIDPVTQLLNSKHALYRISKLDKPSDGRSNALAIFDLRNFRDVNRRFGAAKGDAILVEVSNIFKKITRTSDIVGRLAPEQFILCLSNIEEEAAKSFFDRIQRGLDNTALGVREDEELNVRASMTIYITQDDFSDLNSTLDEMLLALSIKTK